MRSGFLQLLILPAMVHILAQRDSIRPPEVTGRLTLTNIGFAPIPAFSFNGPMITAVLSLKKGRFRYEPDFALGLNGKPWMANNWFRFSILEKRKWKLNTAINPFLFFEDVQDGKNVRFIHVQRNISFELSGEIKPTLRSTVNLTYRFNKGNDGGLTGHLFDLNSLLPIYSWARGLSIVCRPQLFYFDFSGNIDGFFTSGGLILEKQNLPFSFQYQGVWLLKANFPADRFTWNMGLAYIF